MKNIKTIVISLLVIGVFGAYIVYNKFFAAQTPLPVTNTTDNGQDQGQNQNPSPSPSPQPSTGLKDGSYTGQAVDAFYGTVQVKAVIANGRITNVTFLQYPNSAGHTVELSNQVMPVLTAEAISAQSANVDVVSGATQTSQAFMKSLQSALAKAGASDNTNIQVSPPGKAI